MKFDEENCANRTDICPSEYDATAWLSAAAMTPPVVAVVELCAPTPVFVALMGPSTNVSDDDRAPQCLARASSLDKSLLAARAGPATDMYIASL